MADADSKSPVSEQYAAMTANFREAATRIRERADTSAKALGALGTTVLTAVGIIKFGDISPHPPLDEPWVREAIALVIGSFLTMAFVIGFFTRRLYKLNEPLVQKTDPTLMSLDKDELKLIEEVYKQDTDLNQVRSLAALEARAHRLLRIAERLPTPAPAEDGKPAVPDEPRRLQEEAAAIIIAVRYSLTRGALVVTRRRAANAILDGWAKLAASAFVLAVIVFAVASDFLESERSSAIKVATECAAAAKETSIDRSKLPAICAEYLTPEDGDAGGGTTAAKQLNAAREAAMAALGQCEVAVSASGTGAPICERLRAVVANLTEK